MKTVSLAIEGLSLERLLREATDHDVVFLTEQGVVHFALMTADEGDQEICALKSNAEFMAYLTECKERAQTRPRTSLQEMRKLYAVPAEGSNASDGVGDPQAEHNSE